MELAGRVAIVTGAGKGMGPAIAETLAREGADLMLPGRDMAALEKVSAELRSFGRRAYVVRCDVCKAEDVEAAVRKSLEMLGGRIDILVNAAGGTRVHALENGKTLGERTLIAFGGAAPLHVGRAWRT